MTVDDVLKMIDIYILVLGTPETDRSKGALMALNKLREAIIMQLGKENNDQQT